MFVKIPDETARLVPFDAGDGTPAGATAMADTEAGIEQHEAAGASQAQAEVDVLDMEEVALVHAAQVLVDTARHQHERAGDAVDRNRSLRKRLLVAIDPAQAQKVQAQRLDDGAAGR